MARAGKKFGLGTACIGLCLLLVPAYLAGQRSVRRNFSAMSQDTLNRLTLKTRERPATYRLVTDADLLAQAGLERNPDYLRRKADREAFLHVGGLASFLAVYGENDTVRLMLNGVYFATEDDALAYAEAQKSRRRDVAAFRRDTAEGVWLLFVACDPAVAYGPDEMEHIQRGLARYGKRLRLQSLFSQMNPQPGDTP